MSRTTSDDDDFPPPPPPPQTSGVFTRTGSGGRVSAPGSPSAFSDELQQLLQAEQRLTRAVAEQTRLMVALEARLDAPAGRSSTGGGDDGKAVAALESRVLQVLSAMDKRVKAAESRAQAAEEAALRAAAETQALAAQVAELRTAAATRQHAPPPAAQDQWSANPFFDTAPQSAPPAHAPPASAPPPARHSGSSYGGAAPVSYGVTASSYGALPPAPHTAGAVSGSTRAQAAAAEQAAMDVINLIKTQPPAPGAGYMVGTDPSPAAARAAAALAQARARMRNREGGAPPASGGAPFEDGLSSVNRARALLDTIGAEGGVARRSQPAAPLAGLLAQAGADDLT